MNTQEKEYMDMHLVWRSEIKPTEEIVIDETVFHEIYKLQEGNNVRTKNEDRISTRKIRP